MSNTKIELVKGTAFEIDPDKKYLIVFDKRSISMDDLYTLLKALPFNEGTALAVMVDGDPNTAVKVIEDKNEQ